MRTTKVQIRQKGTITLPHELRSRYHLGEGDVLTLLDLGAGSFLFLPHVSEIEHLIDQTASVVADKGASLDDLLETLDQEREAYYQAHFVAS